jgi:SAM-dependent methyltransferase
MFSARAHYGWLHFLVRRMGKVLPQARLAEGLGRRFQRFTDFRTEAFDRKYGTETFTRRWVDCGDGTTWGYGAVNQDFFREIMLRVPVRIPDYDFVDIGCGKGAALMLASEFGFRRIIGVDLSGDLIAIARTNAEKYRQSTGRPFAPEFVQTDFMDWTIPTQNTVFFFNDPFPPELSLRAVQRLEKALAERPGRGILVYRKVPGLVGDHLHASSAWWPVRLSPYWRIYATLPLADELHPRRA